MPKIPLIGDFTVSELKQVISYDAISGVIAPVSNKFRRKKSNVPIGYVTNTFGKSYIRLFIFEKRYLAHRVVWFYTHGYWPDYIDHIDGNGLNNKLENLREAKLSENLKNKRLYSKNKTGVSGVSYIDKAGNYKVNIIVNRETIYLGRYDSIFEAACAKKSAENKYGFHQNHGMERPL